eukprot:scaffold3440_cov135-Isochrysis_galbana.AAC.7
MSGTESSRLSVCEATETADAAWGSGSWTGVIGRKAPPDACDGTCQIPTVAQSLPCTRMGEVKAGGAVGCSSCLVGKRAATRHDLSASGSPLPGDT